MNDQEKIKLLEEYFNNLDDLLTQDEQTIADFITVVEEGVDKNWPIALHIKGYSCYGGNALFASDWDESKRCIEILAQMTEEPDYFNTLGYIYYYGRCNNGTPEYDKAFQCFSVGNACGIYESTYKLADMFQKGLGIPKNNKAAYSLITRIYNDNLQMCSNGIWDTKFADVALRMGGLFENGIGTDIDLVSAYCFYLQAVFAIEKRMSVTDYYGDGKVKKSAKQALERVKIQLPDEFFTDSIEMEEPAIVGDLLSNSAWLDVTIKKVDGQYYLSAAGYAAEGCSGSSLITVGAMNYCKVVDHTGYYLENVEFGDTGNSLNSTYMITDIQLNPVTEYWEFKYRDQVLIALKCNQFVFAEKM